MADDTPQPVRGSMGRLHYFAGDETRYEPMSLAIGRIVVHKHIIGMLSSLGQAFRRLLVRLWYRVQRYRLPSATPSDQDAADVKV